MFLGGLQRNESPMPKTEIEFDILAERVGKEDAVKYLDSKFDLLRLMVVNRPGPGTPLTDREVTHWRNKFVAYYGKVLGNMECLGNFGILPIDMVRAYETKLKVMLQYHISAVLIGKQ
jgi:hypothetical protein